MDENKMGYPFGAGQAHIGMDDSYANDYNQRPSIQHIILQGGSNHEDDITIPIDQLPQFL